MGTIFEVDWRTGIAVDRSLYGSVAFVLERPLGFDGSIGNTHERLQLFVLARVVELDSPVWNHSIPIGLRHVQRLCNMVRPIYPVLARFAWMANQCGFAFITVGEMEALWLL